MNKSFQQQIEEYDADYPSHHWYGHVEDVSEVDFGKYMFGIPAIVVVLAFCLATGLWPALLLFWILWQIAKGI